MCAHLFPLSMNSVECFESIKMSVDDDIEMSWFDVPVHSIRAYLNSLTHTELITHKIRFNKCESNLNGGEPQV